MTRRAASRASGAGAGDVDFFADGPAPWISRRDARHPLRKPSLYAEVLRIDDRALLCGLAAEMLDETAGGSGDRGVLLSADFVGRVRALRRA